MPRKFNSGIYQISCSKTNKIYIGSALKLNKRWREHLSLLRRGIHYNRYLQRSWNKHGERSHIFKIVETVSDENKLVIREQSWIDKLDVTDPIKGFNLSPTAGSNLGYKFTEEQKKKLSKTHTGKFLPESQKKAISASMKGIEHGPIKRQRLSEAHAFVTKEEHFNIMDDYYFTGVSQPDLAKLYNVTRTAMNRMINGKSYKIWHGEWLAMNNLDQLPLVTRGSTKLTRDDVFDILNRLHACEQSKNIASMYEMSRSVVSELRKGNKFKKIRDEWIQQRKMTKQELKRFVSRPSKFTSKDKVKINKLITQGIKQKDIAKSYGVSPQTICDIKYGRQ